MHSLASLITFLPLHIRQHGIPTVYLYTTGSYLSVEDPAPES